MIDEKTFKNNILNCWNLTNPYIHFSYGVQSEVPILSAQCGDIYTAVNVSFPMSKELLDMFERELIKSITQNALRGVYERT